MKSAAFEGGSWDQLVYCVVQVRGLLLTSHVIRVDPVLRIDHYEISSVSRDVKAMRMNPQGDLSPLNGSATLGSGNVSPWLGFTTKKPTVKAKALVLSSLILSGLRARGSR